MNDSGEFAISDFDLGRTVTAAPRARTPGRHFVKGPIDLGWIVDAGNLPGRALFVAVLLRYFSGLKRSTRFRLSVSSLKKFGLPRSTAARAVQALVNAGLVRIERSPGRALVVTIVEVDQREETR